MTQIDELQSRIARALERIGKGLEGLPDAASLRAALAEAADFRQNADATPTRADSAPAVEIDAVIDDVAAEPEMAQAPVDADELAQLRAALDDERVANAQLEERLRRLKAQQDAAPPDLSQQIADQKKAIATLDEELQRLRRANQMLMDNNSALREAMSEGVSEPHLINKAMLVELESIRATRAAEAAETRLLHDTLAPLVTAAQSREAGQ
ncbi:hypothetical protein KUH32_15050 [Thalassococcus sp. CAU 1522]|uniref:Colicin transporter n=1 Tax=Thalassococcus arenae TaxID=2851652 RepID=A0ABS6NAN3_9RHOB|nr:hypothetical protein [Thalassococcus arenae]MBV2361081.1 hypothetical protein [Thalassococcus arenae]